MGAHPELEAEQAHIDRAYERLDQLRSDAESLLRSVLDQGRGGTHQFREERDVIVRTSLARIDQLDIGEQALCFGRIDRRNHDASIESFHIGRLGISGDDVDPLVVDWRAPVAEPFYRATGRDPMDLVLRRHLAAHGRRIVGIEDERFGRTPVAGDGRPSADGAGPPSDGDDSVEDAALELGGPGALLAVLEGARTGYMRDIISTIQREQDEIIRAPLPGVLVVQGGPGTGKTAVALHRAAYLLYTHRFPLERQGVLVIGPNPLFLRYIEHVLPSLGESGVTLSTITGIVHGVQQRAQEPPAVARLKGEARMANVVTQAVRTRQRPLRQSVDVPYGATVLHLTADVSASVIAAARRRPGTHNARRRFVEQLVVRRLADDYQRAVRIHRGSLPAPDPWPQTQTPAPPVSETRPPTLFDTSDGRTGHADNDGPGARDGAPRNGFSDGNGKISGADATSMDATSMDATSMDATSMDAENDAPEEPVFDLAEFSRQIRSLPQLAEALDRMWPRLSAEELLHDLFGSPPLLALAARGVLTAAEQAFLVRDRSGSLVEIPWTAADLALIDEARVLLGKRRSRRGAGTEFDDDPRTYGQIVVDEAQDLSPMQLRMVARRSLSGSVTVVGDIGQATGPWAPAGWDEVTAHLPGERPPRLVELTVSYRTPAEVVEVASRVLAEAAPQLRPPRPVRGSGHAPLFVDAAGDLAGAVVSAAADLVAEVAPGTAAVLAPASLVGELALALDEAGYQAIDPRRDGLGSPLSLLPVDLANGLEFDAVIVVEPAAIAEESPQGLRALYVALTRPTQRLVVVHARPLPASLHD
ncbi:MAG TPA: ATP-binding domain-containing protein [Acidimicrobiales bacterium]|nr:ATP-binding domain-containing protein [Acidimicrobiales bacterium]